jgi:hypothetical protein
LTNTSNKEIAKLLAQKFIARSDVKAIQRHNGEYNPVAEPFSMTDLLDHIEGRKTYGHYFLNQDNQCKLFAFDIDLDKTDEKNNKTYLVPTAVTEDGVWTDFVQGNPRELWLNRANVLQRNYFKYLLRMMAHKLAAAIHNSLEIPTAVAYTGAKGVHVYGFTGLMNAADVRDGAQIILDDLNCFEPLRGNCFYKHKQETTAGNLDPELSYDGLTVEIFPKQVTLDGKTHGNLMRLPLGRNQKNPKDPTFFLDLRGNFGEQSFMVRDPVDALTTTDQWVWASALASAA